MSLPVSPRDQLAGVRNPLPARLQRIMLLGILAGLLLTGSVVFISQQMSTRAALVDELRSYALLLGKRSVAAIVFMDAQTARQNLGAARNASVVQRLCLFDANGRLFSEYAQEQSRLGTCNARIDTGSVQPDARFAAGHVELLVPIIERGERAAYMQIHGSLGKIQLRMWQDILTLLLASALACLLAFVLARRQLRKALQPLHALHEHTRRISTGETGLLEDGGLPLHSPFNDEIHDLTSAYRQMMQVISQEQIRVQHSESRFRSLAEHSPVGIFLYLGHDELAYVNRRWTQLTGCHMPEAAGSFTARLHPEDREDYLATRAQVLCDGEPAKVEYRLRMPQQGQERVLVDYLSPIVENGCTTAVIGSSLDISELKSAQQELQHMAYHDALTGLPNRRFFRMHLDLRVAAALKEGRKLSVLLIDLDDFKHVNDTLGHDAGDLLLRIISERFRDLVFKEDVVARLGGDEFIILIEHGELADPLEQVIDKILTAANLATDIHDHRIEVSCSIGVARCPNDAQTGRELMRNADIAMYHAKQKGKNHAELFSPEMNVRLQRRVWLERKLRAALREERLALFIQPQFDARQQRFIWGEALLRWPDEEERWISPQQFIPIAEESNLIADLGDWMMHQVCALLSQHLPALHEIGIRGISVNLSAREFYDRGLVGRLTRTIDEYAIDPSALEFELTESLVMRDIKRAAQAISQLRDLGFKLALDDFGTGHSSLAQLKRFCIDRLKIDKSFVDGLPLDPNDVAITNAILALAEELGLDVIAEGIETQAQSDYLISRRCIQMQGYYYARPMPVSELLQLGATPPVRASLG